MRKLALLALCTAIVGTATTAQAGDSCGVTFYKYKDLKGISASFFGPAAVRDMDDLRYSNGEDLDNDVKSVGTLSSTWLEIYSEEDFAKPKYQLPPNTWRNVTDVESYRVRCEPPAGYETPDEGPIQ